MLQGDEQSSNGSQKQGLQAWRVTSQSRVEEMHSQYPLTILRIGEDERRVVGLWIKPQHEAIGYLKHITVIDQDSGGEALSRLCVTTLDCGERLPDARGAVNHPRPEREVEPDLVAYIGVGCRGDLAALDGYTTRTPVLHARRGDRRGLDGCDRRELILSIQRMDRREIR